MKKQIQFRILFSLLLVFGLSNAYGQYCTTVGASSTADDDISNVTLVGSFGTQINNATSCYATVPQYVDNTTTLPGVSLIPGNTYSISVTLTQCSGNFYTNSCNVWIDFNRNFTFETSELVANLVASNPFPSTHVASFTVPAGATLGVSRMRLSQMEGGTSTSILPCATTTWGEVEDYLVNLVSASGGGPVLPPIANFFPSQSTTTTVPTDTVWINSPYDLVSTSTNSTRTYWDLPGVTPLAPGYARGPVAWTAQQYIDTAKYDRKFRYTYRTRGFWPVRLLAINSLKRDSLRDSIVKYIWVDTPNTKPVPNFFAARRKVGIGDYVSLLDISTGGPNMWYWTFDPACNLCTTPPYFNNFFAGPTDQNPLFFAGDPGKFAICLQVWNDRGWDTICKKDYIEVINSINVCSGSGSSNTTEKEGYMFGPSGTGLSYTRSQVSGCPGLLIEPCADSIILWVDRLKMLPTDTLVIHNGTSQSAPILRKLGGSSASLLPASILQNGIRGGSRLFVRFMVGTGGIPTPYDSAGFSIRWEIKPASYPKPTSKMVLQDTIFSLQPVLYTATSTGTLMKYSWDTDGNGTYDSTGATATRNFLVTTPQYKKLCLVTYNCVGSDTVCKNVLFLPTTQRPVTRFDADKVQGFNTDTFRFTDKSLYGPSIWKWTFTPATAQYLLGTSSTSKNPVIRFTQRTKYMVKLVVTNQYGSDSLTKVDYVNIGAYGDPYCATDMGLSDGSIGIARVKLQNGIDTATNATTPCFQIVGGNQAGTMYRGVKHGLNVTRPAITTAMDRKAWIDFNMDGIFSTDELVMNDLGGTTLTRTDSILVSTTQRLGSTRMRVGVTLAGTTLNPDLTFLGVFRDYVVNFPQDTVKPIAILNNSSTFYTEIHKAFVDPGITATDNIEGNISAKYETIGSVDTSKVGPNYLKYIVRDLYGNISDTLIRTVFVILNQTGPSIVLNGASQVYVEVYKKYTEPGYVAKDNQGTIITDQVVVTTNLDTAKLGQYTNTYLIVDAFGLSANKLRAVTVGDSTRPIVTPKVSVPGSPYIHQVGTAIDLSKIVDVTDNYWSRSFIDLTIQGTVDVNNVGSYFISYVARDNSGNIGDLVMVRVDVRDTKAPTLTLNGVSPMNWEVKNAFVDPWVTPLDNYWPASTVVVSRKGVVNTNVLGEYTLWYIATDPSGNKDSVSRVVKVVDTTKPRIDLLGINEVNLPRWQEYVDQPVSVSDNYNSASQMTILSVNSLPLHPVTKKPFGDYPGLFSVRYTVKDLSGNQSDEAVRTINVLEGITGTNEVMTIDRLMSIYPNPSNGLVNMRLAIAQAQDVQIKVLDILGNEISSQTIKSNDLQVKELDLTSHAKGFYFLRVQTGEKVFVKKLQVN
ncbi:MAG: hypothetical protein CFE21_02340 [Bacteroidetes bacterium B1(2017)]|nr:MAG: hypothetical protein CFE21_02340 [Bacteroidetes bacterium B1(2017)]